ncbi:hypothetical protein L0657_19605 [Dyadobacter sp. CY345]|uniref:hypothetical protein n=1 Tax=Dyadobacter sp. CY345 TaxID=2909335 RepID=UPI001F16B005|nr:hypothetical protein [Dyadobacter sp. CY345]MCF2446173.1 hypothetical protein [Dyadobacter sp. CY345]
MYTSISGIYENGILTLAETPPTKKKSKVVVLFLEELDQPANLRREPGGLLRLKNPQQKEMALPENFNDSLDELSEYM